jgi:hypothetical protein
MRWAGHVAGMKEMRYAYKILAAKTGRYHLEEVGVDGKIILKLILKM